MREIISPLDGLRSPFGFIRGGGVVPFSPSTLFASGEEGAWYEPSTTTAFRSTTNLTPCDYGQSAGFLLDLSKGARYSGGSFTGPNLLTGSWADQDQGAGTSSVSGGEITLSGTDSSNRGARSQTVSNESTKSVVIELDVVVVSGSISVAFVSETSWPPTANADQIKTISATGSYSFLLEGDGFNNTVWLFTGSSGGSGTITNISVRELPGNHATQGTESARPILARVPETGRRNLLERTEEFDDAAWVANGGSPRADQFVTANADNSPNGGLTADRLTFSSSFTNTWWGQSGITFQSGVTYTFSVWLKRVSGSGSIQINTNPYGSGGSWVTVAVTSEWQRLSVTQTATATTSPTAAAGILAVEAGQVVDVWGAQLEEGSSATAYQKVVDQYDITEAGVTSLEYLFRDGADDHLTIPAIFTGTEDVTYIEAYDPDGLNWMLLTREGSFLNVLGIGESGSTNSAVVDGATLSSIRFDGVTDATGTRGGLYTSSQAANVVTLQATLSSANWNNPMTWSQYANGSTFDSIGSKSFGFLFVNRDVTTEERANLETYFGNRAGVSI